MKSAFYRPGLLAVLMTVSFSSALSQQELFQQLDGLTRLDEIMTVVDNYYAQQGLAPDDFENAYLHWKRWEWYMSGRLGPDGEFVNVSEMLMAGLDDKKKMEIPQDRTINSGWTFIGPSTSPLQNPSAIYNGIGRVDRIAFHPSNENIIYIGTPAGGLWRTTNGGSSWVNLTDQIPSLGVSGIAITPSNPNIIYILTGDGDSNIGGGLVVNMGYMRQSIGVLKSTDGGISWHQTGTFPGTAGTFVGYRLIQSPDDVNLLIAATSDGLYRTINGGTTWVQERTGVHYDVEFKPGDPTRVYASVPGDIWISTNSGDTWTSNSTYDFNPANCSGGGRIEIAVAPTNTPKVYLLAGPVTGSGSFCGLYLSTDSGASFTRQSNTPNILGNADDGSDNNDQSNYDHAIACRTSLSTNIAVAGTTVWRSTNGGSSWLNSTSYNENGGFPYIHPDVHDLAYNPLNHWLYAATDGGFYRSQDHGITWTDLSPNIETSQLYHMRGWEGTVNKMMGGFQDNGVKYRQANSSAWWHISGADGFDVTFNPDTGEPGYATINSGVTRYSNNGQNSTGITPGNNNFFKTIAVHNTNPDTILVGASDIFRSYDAGENYTNEGASGSWSLTSCPSNNSRFYAAGGNGFSNGAGNLYISDDNGNSWTIISGNPGFPAAANWVKITDVTVRPNNSPQVWACFGGFNAGFKVVYSGNAGDTWTNLSANLPNVPINCLAIDEDNGAYAGTDIGVFYRPPTANNWMPWSNGLPNTPVTDLHIFDDGVTRRIRASTFGRGVWQSNLAETCDAAILVTGNLEGIRHYEAATSVSSSADVEGGIGTFVSFQSGNYIDLTEGFEVIENSEFLGFISPCGQGGIPTLQDQGEGEGRSTELIILLRRMYDENGMPYGGIKDLRVENQQAQVLFGIRNPGEVALVAAKPVQQKLEYLYQGTMDAGHQQMTFDLSALSNEPHYLILFYNGKVAHFQELKLE